MQMDSTQTEQPGAIPPGAPENHAAQRRPARSTLDATAPGQLRVIKRNGTVVPYDESKIDVAITKAFLAVEGGTAAASSRIRELVGELGDQVTRTFSRRMPSGGTIHIEEVQDQVELALMRSGEHRVARSYVLYRDERARAREAEAAAAAIELPADPGIDVTLDDGTVAPLDLERLQVVVSEACHGLEGVQPQRILDEALKNMFHGISQKDVGTSLVISARTLVEEEPNYTFATARLLMDELRREALTALDVRREGAEPGDHAATQAQMTEIYARALGVYVRRGIELELLDPELGRYDIARLGAALKPERDLSFTYLGLQTLYDRYFLHSDGVRIELPQCFFMRVAMGLAQQEDDREARAIEFYDLLSSFDYMSSTPTLFNAGTLRPQLSSCYLTTVPDDLHGIFGAIHDNAMLSKFAGGLGNDWTPVRALGSYIKGTNGKSQGVVPFLKVVNDTAVAVNQGGKRKGAVCAYLETWHLDIEEFLELRKNTGDDRRRTHDMNTANWVPDLFMKRVMEDGDWTLFSPSETPDLHDLTGSAFEQRYVQYEQMADRGELGLFRRIRAADLWRKMLSMLFETGHPWITFKDSCNLRSPQQHAGVIHSSNLCTEITLNTSEDEIAVCNLGSVNLAQHVDASGVDLAKLEKTVRTAVRMLDNVIDINY
ncbi:MAG: ribonucleoside-diphosphate reductase subunit alpha, partial [Pseudomonadales bacterium]|nr:ribonucleoside-diphosphate reductase subunit alpha [Pseudomonadales bacterium]